MISCEFCEIYKKNLFTEHLWVTASIYTQTYTKKITKGSKYSTASINWSSQREVF